RRHTRSYGDWSSDVCSSDLLLALDPATGKTLWHLNMGGRLVASPMTYLLDDRQYLIIPVEDILYAFVLPEHLVAGPQSQTTETTNTRPFHSSSTPPGAPWNKGLTK